MMTLNAFYGAGRVTRIRDGQFGAGFVLSRAGCSARL
jgi:hypothetical protein